MIIDFPKAEQYPMLKGLWKEAFSDTDEFLSSFWNSAFSADRCRCVTVDGKAVSALYWFDCSCRGRKIAYLYAIATLKEYRGRGICRALMEDTRRHMSSLGYSGAVLVPGGRELFGFYEKLGYRTCGSVSEFTSCSSQKSIEIREIDICEYARLRRSFLSEGGVIQEKENIEFLKTMASLYTGDGFLLAARVEGNKLHGLELLGNSDTAADILYTLGCAEGKFRACGGDTPFAMYASFDGDISKAPSYFGLAFD